MKTLRGTSRHPDEIAERRGERFFGSAYRPGYGLCADFERTGDRLWQADEIARALADRVPDGYGAVIERFRFSVRAGCFGPPASKGRFAAPEVLSYDQRSRAETTRNLIDLDSAVLRPPEPGQYAIRPSALVAGVYAPYMRARQSVWAHWIEAQGWQMPPGFGAPVIEREAVTIETPNDRIGTRNRGGRPPDVAESVKTWFDGLPERDKALSAQKLAESYQADGLPGSPDHVRKLIAELKSRLPS